MPRNRIQVIIDEATNPRNTCSNDEKSKELCDEVSKYRNGEFTALNMLIERLRTFDVKIALQALNVIEYMTEHLGESFRDLIGRNTFLNEFAKMLSPKYDSDRCPREIKDRISIILQHWYRTLPQYNKILVCYKTLRAKGYLTDEIKKPKSKVEEEEVIGDQDTNKTLSDLLKSSQSADLEKANRLIKTMVLKEENRSINIFNRKEEIFEIHEKISEMRKLMTEFRTSKTIDVNQLRILRKELFEYHKGINEIANEALSERDPHIDDLLSLSDDLTSVLNDYIAMKSEAQREVVMEIIGEAPYGKSMETTVDDDLIDFNDFGEPPRKQEAPKLSTNDELLDLFDSEPLPSKPAPSSTIPGELFNISVTQQPMAGQFVSNVQPALQGGFYGNQMGGQFMPGPVMQMGLPQYSSQPTMPGMVSQPTMPGMVSQPAMPGMVSQPAMPGMVSQPTMASMLSQPIYSMGNTQSQFIAPSTLQSSTNVKSTVKQPEEIFDSFLGNSIDDIMSAQKSNVPFAKFTVDMTNLEIIKSVPVAGSKLGCFIALAKDKRITSTSEPVPVIYVLSLMNMLTTNIEEISLVFQDSVMNARILLPTPNYLIAYAPLTPVSTSNTIILCDKNTSNINVCLHYKTMDHDVRELLGLDLTQLHI